MKRLSEEMDAREFLRTIFRKDRNLTPCLNPNGECVEFARKGKCKAYN